jgi:uncharacterized protein (TIGR02217 family)
MSFADVRLPEEVEQGANGGPGFKTTIIILGNGTEQRNQDWQEARGKWDVSYGVQNKEDYDLTLQFFYARRGRLTGFRFKDWSDFEVTDQLLGLGDGANLDFQLIRIYSAASGPYTRVITRPVASTIVVRVNDVVNTNWTLQSGGIIRFNMGFAPAVSAEVNADFEFDVPVRFDTDQFTLVLEPSTAAAIGNLPLLEILE